MPDVARSLVTNTTPLIALAVGVGNLDILRTIYDRVVVPLEVCEEIHAHGNDAPGVYAFDRADWLERLPAPAVISPYLRNTLDRGEASVIQTALDLQIPLVCIDESVGRRVARLSGLALTGSIGVLIKAAAVPEYLSKRVHPPGRTGRLPNAVKSSPVRGPLVPTLQRGNAVRALRVPSGYRTRSARSCSCACAWEQAALNLTALGRRPVRNVHLLERQINEKTSAMTTEPRTEPLIDPFGRRTGASLPPDPGPAARRRSGTLLPPGSQRHPRRLHHPAVPRLLCDLQPGPTHRGRHPAPGGCRRDFRLGLAHPIDDPTVRSTPLQRVLESTHVRPSQHQEIRRSDRTDRSPARVRRLQRSGDHRPAARSSPTERGTVGRARAPARRHPGCGFPERHRRYGPCPGYPQFDDAAAERCGETRADLARRGTPIGPYDLQIAAIALRHGLSVVTNNTDEFRRVTGLLVEDWQSG